MRHQLNVFWGVTAAARGSPYRIDTDYLGRKRNDANPFPGPFVLPKRDRQELRVWACHDVLRC